MDSDDHNSDIHEECDGDILCGGLRDGDGTPCADCCIDDQAHKYGRSPEYLLALEYPLAPEYGLIPEYPLADHHISV
jgi:hypothetical protein